MPSEDAFVFLAAVGSPPIYVDTIPDFKPGSDKIDLAAIDANVDQTGDQAFHFVGQTDGHTVVENSLTWHYDPRSDQTYILADTDADTATAEVEIAVAGMVTLTQHDFIL